MKILLCVLLSTLAAVPQTMRVQRRAAAGGGGISVIDGTNKEGGVGTQTAAHALNQALHDQLWLEVYWQIGSGTCPGSQVLTFSDTAGDAWALIGTTIRNEWTGQQCIAQYHVADTAANASNVVQVVFGTPGSLNGFNVIQMRGTANAAPDQTANFNSSAGVGTTGVTPSVTTTVAPAIFVAGFLASSNTTITPTANACFGVTGLVPPNTGSGAAAVQYRTLSSTQTGTCSFTQTASQSRILQAATFH